MLAVIIPHTGTNRQVQNINQCLITDISVLLKIYTSFKIFPSCVKIKSICSKKRLTPTAMACANGLVKYVKKEIHPIDEEMRQCENDDDSNESMKPMMDSRNALSGNTARFL